MDINTIIDNWVKAEDAAFNPLTSLNPNKVVPLGLTVNQLCFVRNTLEAHLRHLEPTTFVPAIQSHYLEVKELLSYINQVLQSEEAERELPGMWKLQNSNVSAKFDEGEHIEPTELY